MRHLRSQPAAPADARPLPDESITCWTTPARRGPGACDIFNIKPARVGGWPRRGHPRPARHHGARLVRRHVRDRRRAAQLALASLPGFTLPGDISATERYYEVDITPPFVLNAEDSTMDVPAGPGLGVEVDRQQLKRVTLHQEHFQAG